MKYTDEKLTVRGTSIYTEGGKFICSIAMTDRAVELNNDDGWDRCNESWISYRERTATERYMELQKSIDFAIELAAAYNTTIEINEQRRTK